MRTNFFIILIAGIFCTNCGKNQKLIDSENTVSIFFNSVNDSNEGLMKEYYPNISTFDSYFKSDSIKIKESKFVNDSLISVSTTNYFTNGFGKKSVRDIDLYLLPDSLQAYSKIVDSKGMTNHNKNELYSFAVKTGCIKKHDTTDIQINNKYLNAYLLSRTYTIEKLMDLLTDVSVVEWNWKKGYAGSASGKGIVKNNSAYDIPKVKYEITFKDKSGNDITTDDGYITYDVLRAGEFKSFTFYTNYVGNGAVSATILLDFDENIVKKYVLESDYNGDEYDVFVSKSSEIE